MNFNKIIKFLKPQELLIISILIFITNLLFKSHKLGEQSLWYDECFSLFHSQRVFSAIIWVAENDQNPPLYNFILKGWTYLFGISEFNIRFLSVLFSSFSGVLLFHFANKYLNKETAIIVSILYLISGQHLFYAQEARGFAINTFLTIASVYLVFELIYFPSFKKAILLGFVNVCILYIHYIAGLVFISEIFTFFILFKSSKTKFKYFMTAVLTTLLLFSPWIKVLIKIYKSTHEKTWLAKPTVNELIGVFNDFAMNRTLYWVYFSIILIGLGIIYNDKDKLKWYFILAIWGFGPIFIDYFIATITPVFLLRYILFASIGIMLLVAYIFSVSNLNRYLKLAILGFIVISSLSVLDFNPSKKQNYRDGVSYIKNEKDSNTLVILQTIDLSNLFSYYYDKGIFLNDDKFIERLKNENIVLANDSTWIKDIPIENFTKIILTQSFEGYTDPNGTLFNDLNRRLVIDKQTKEFEGITITHFKPKL